MTTPKTLATWAMTAEPDAILDRAFPGMKQQAIADVLGAPQSTVSEWRSGKTGMGRPMRTHILRILGVGLVDGEWARL